MVPQHVLITGTTSGIGRGLLSHYVSKGVRVTAVNRRDDHELTALFPEVRFRCADVRNSKAVFELVREMADKNDFPDLFILNAGINRLDNEECLVLEDFRDALETNLFGALNFVSPLTTFRPRLPKVTVLAVSSMINYLPNPYCLGYYVSKNALSDSFDVLSAMYRDTNLQFKWVVLGPVRTPIASTSEKFPKVMSRIKDIFSVSQARSVRAIGRFAETSRRKLVFPLHAFFLFQAVRFAQFLIPGFYRCRKSPESVPSQTPPGEIIADSKR